MDWGQLTNLTGSEVPGQGAPIGVPIRIIAINNGSGTVNGFNNFAEAGSGSSTCASKSTYNANGAQGPNPNTPQGNASNPEIALENNAAQIGDFANANWGANDAADQAVDIATSLYFISFGVYNTNPVATQASIETNPGVIPTGLPAAFTSSILSSNNILPSTSFDRSNHYPISRTLFNIYNATNIKASTGGFLNWMCDGGTASGTGTGAVSPLQAKGPDRFTGVNYDTDLTNIIQSKYGFSRLTDTTPELQVASQTVNGVVNPNGTCAAQGTITRSPRVPTRSHCRAFLRRCRSAGPSRSPTVTRRPSGSPARVGLATASPGTPSTPSRASAATPSRWPTTRRRARAQGTAHAVLPRPPTGPGGDERQRLIWRLDGSAD